MDQGVSVHAHIDMRLNIDLKQNCKKMNTSVHPMVIFKSDPIMTQI